MEGDLTADPTTAWAEGQRADAAEVRLAELEIPGLAEASPTVQRSAAFLRDITSLLVAKNKRYGDSAANPRRVFSRASPVEQILVRIDDKLSRIRTTGIGRQDDGEDPIADLVGYLALLVAVRDAPPDAGVG